MTGDAPPAKRCKVGRLIADHDLTDAGDELERRWTAETADRWSLRDLADWFNKQLLTALLGEYDQHPVEESVETTYQLLTDGDVSPASRTQAKRDLERRGIDVESLLDEFVSHQAVHTYLTEYRNVSPTGADRSTTVEQVEETIMRLQSKTVAVTETNIDRLVANGSIDLDEFDVLVDIKILCGTCGSAYDVDELLGAGGCTCFQTPLQP